MKQLICIIVLCVVFVGLLFIIRWNHRFSTTVSDIQHFSFHYTMDMAYHADVSYEVNCEKKCVATYKPYGVAEEDAIEREVDSSFMKQLSDILNRYHVSQWDGFQKSDPYVLDGNSFSFSLITKNDQSISASGYMKYPKNYASFKKEVDSLFQKLK